MYMSYLTFLGQIILAAALGAGVGWQREYIGKAAGSRTFAMVAMGSAIFTLLSLRAFGAADTSRVAAQVLTGIGFIGAGTIIHKAGGIEGLTTAACLWAMAAIGMAVGAGWYGEAIIAAVMMFLILVIRHHDKKWKK